ncbi:Acetylornithine deacetylase [Thioalkalivibrio nitratireducens DSM 14787]|uniref:Acetylornithine deacetylase n=1 Tax=Thioalkalivibrio nitratireducens (strain DSM 14787 / UNIQEM 213 / ALEN2) TaxID=1255043 RepID=L0DXI0_THIND|nr:acetylornithine deacetylase [Thioalkalivibrio nitratireducens]AGA33670.1 Acetylornithine deacetylase [Thioalkalivibrio nitratireducens DSM 14787]
MMATTLSDVRAMLERLVAFDTVSRNSNLDLIDFVRDRLARQGVAADLIANGDGTKANLLATVGPRVEGGVVLSGHTDVVPVDGQAWTTDPFRLEERGGRLYGRGSCDMKGFVAIALALVPEMKALRRPIHLALSYDEEVGCRGAPSLVEAVGRLPRPAAVIVGEPTGMRVITAHKGITVARTHVRGHQMHSSQAHRGVSAVATAARLITYLDDVADARAVSGPFGPGFEPSHTTVHVGVVHGGTAVNIVARDCRFDWDIRSVPGDDPARILNDFAEHCRTQVEPAMREIAADTGITTEILMEAPALAHEGRNPAIDLACRLSGREDTGRVPFAAEAGLFQRAGFASVVCGPGSIDQAHQPDEFITLEQLEAGLRFQQRLVSALS